MFLALLADDSPVEGMVSPGVLIRDGDLDSESDAGIFESHVLGSTAIEEFVTERLVPLLAGAKEPGLSKLQAVLRQAGLRHNRRYVVESTS